MSQCNADLIQYANDEIIGQGNFDVVDEVFASDYVLHSGGKEFNGTGFVRRFIGQLRSALPDFRVLEVIILTEAGDPLAWQRTLSGTHQVNLMGIPPSGKKVEWRDLLVTRFDGGKIAEEWAVSDLASQLLLSLPRA